MTINHSLKNLLEKSKPILMAIDDGLLAIYFPKNKLSEATKLHQFLNTEDSHEHLVPQLSENRKDSLGLHAIYFSASGNEKKDLLNLIERNSDIPVFEEKGCLGFNDAPWQKLIDALKEQLEQQLDKVKS